MAIFFGALIWLFVSWGWLDLANKGALTWIVLVIVALVLTPGCHGPISGGGSPDKQPSTKSKSAEPRDETPALAAMRT